MNLNKHKVSIKEAEQVFFDKKTFQFEDTKHSGKEERFIIIGKTKTKRILHIVFTLRDKKIRIISARDTNKKERIEYENNKK